MTRDRERTRDRGQIKESVIATICTSKGFGGPKYEEKFKKFTKESALSDDTLTFSLCRRRAAPGTQEGDKRVFLHAAGGKEGGQKGKKK